MGFWVGKRALVTGDALFIFDTTFTFLWGCGGARMCCCLIAVICISALSSLGCPTQR